MYTCKDLLRARVVSSASDAGPMASLRLEAIPSEEAARGRKEKLKEAFKGQPKEHKPIGPIYEAIPVEAERLKRHREELRLIERQTGAMISEKAGLRGRCTVIIQGTQAIVEKALPIVEALFDEEQTSRERQAAPPCVKSTSAERLPPPQSQPPPQPSSSMERLPPGLLAIERQPGPSSPPASGMERLQTDLHVQERQQAALAQQPSPTAAAERQTASLQGSSQGSHVREGHRPPPPPPKPTAVALPAGAPQPPPPKRPVVPKQQPPPLPNQESQPSNDPTHEHDFSVASAATPVPPLKPSSEQLHVSASSTAALPDSDAVPSDGRQDEVATPPCDGPSIAGEAMADDDWEIPDHWAKDSQSSKKQEGSQTWKPQLVHKQDGYKQNQTAAQPPWSISGARSEWSDWRETGWDRHPDCDKWEEKSGGESVWERVADPKTESEAHWPSQKEGGFETGFPQRCDDDSLNNAEGKTSAWFVDDDRKVPNASWWETDAPWVDNHTSAHAAQLEACLEEDDGWWDGDTWDTGTDPQLTLPSPKETFPPSQEDAAELSPTSEQEATSTVQEPLRGRWRQPRAASAPLRDNDSVPDASPTRHACNSDVDEEPQHPLAASFQPPERCEDQHPAVQVTGSGPVVAPPASRPPPAPHLVEASPTRTPPAPVPPSGPPPAPSRTNSPPPVPPPPAPVAAKIEEVTVRGSVPPTHVPDVWRAVENDEESKASDDESEQEVAEVEHTRAMPIAEIEKAASSDHDDGMWDEDPIATWHGASSSSKPPESIVRKNPPPAPPPPVPPPVKAKGPPPLPPSVSAPVVSSSPMSQALEDEGEDSEGVGRAPDSDSGKEDSAARRRRKKKEKKKQKKTEASLQQAPKQPPEKPVEKTAPPRPKPSAKQEGGKMQHLHSKTAFAGLQMGASSSTEEDEDELNEVTASTPVAKSKAKATSAKARPVEKKKNENQLEVSKASSPKAKGKATPPITTVPKPGPTPAPVAKPSPPVSAKLPPPGIAAKPTVAEVVEAAPPASKAGRQAPPPPPMIPRPAPPPVPVAFASSSSSSAAPRPAYEKDAELARQLQQEITVDDDDVFWETLTRLPGKSSENASGNASGGASPAAKAARAKAKGPAAKPKSAKAPAAKALNPLPQKALNPLPQRAAAKAIPVMLNGGLAGAAVSENAASSAKWAERPVEKIVIGAHYEEEEDPELACYLWDRKAQRPKRDQARVAPAAPPPSLANAPPLTATRAPAPPPQRQRFLLSKVVEMGFDEQTARRALTTTGWAGIEEAIAVLLT